jgi:hypothetical protein
MFSDIGAPDEMVFEINQEIAKADELAGLQLADVAAYLCVNALAKKQKFPFYAEQLARLRYWTNSKFVSPSKEGIIPS